jgi:hypothetical protein
MAIDGAAAARALNAFNEAVPVDAATRFDRSGLAPRWVVAQPLCAACSHCSLLAATPAAVPPHRLRTG